MALHEISNEYLDSKYVNSYATEEGLRKRIRQDRELYPDYYDHFIIVRTPRGRWTALVQLDTSKGGSMARYSGLTKI